MAHARRYFEKVLDSDAERAGHALSEIQKLYAIRPIALDRKNYLLEGSHAAAQRIALSYSPRVAAKYITLNPTATRLPHQPDRRTTAPSMETLTN